MARCDGLVNPWLYLIILPIGALSVVYPGYLLQEWLTLRAVSTGMALLAWMAYGVAYAPLVFYFGRAILLHEKDETAQRRAIGLLADSGIRIEYLVALEVRWVLETHLPSEVSSHQRSQLHHSTVAPHGQNNTRRL